MNFSRVIATGSSLPKKALTNFDLEKMVDTSDQWIFERSGIKERHILAENEKLSDMTVEAAKNAISAAGISINEIDMVIVATLTSELLSPSAACILQDRLGIKNRPAFDLNAACAGFIYGLSIADQYIKTGAAKCILLVASEAVSKVLDWRDRATCVLFGDGAGAVILKPDNKPGIRATHIIADGSYVPLLYVPSPLYTFNKPHYINMLGKEVFKIAVNKLSESFQKILDENNIDSSDITWLVPHQANLRIIQSLAKKINLSMEKVILTIEKHGNTSAASVPLAFDVGVRDGRIKRGDTLLMDAFGAGFTWGAALLDF